MNIVIANSVGVDEKGNYIIHSPSRWSYGVKNYREVFTYYPWELAYTSTFLKKHTKHNIYFIDGCLKKYNRHEYAEIIKKYSPDILIMESSTRTINEDIKLAKDIKSQCGAEFILAGQHATAFPEEMSKIADHVCIGEYEYTVLDIISRKRKEDILGLYPNKRRPLININTLEWPEDEDVKRIDYANPGEPNCEYTEIQMYATRGCPVMCNFCVCSNLYYAKPNYRIRKIDNIIEEIKYLKKKYPEMEGIFFDEEGHNYNREFILNFCDALVKNGLNDLKINAMCGYSSLDIETLTAMKKAGYYKLRVGIETGSKKVADSMGLKGKFDLLKLRKSLKIAKDIGIKIYGTFTTGALGSTYDEDMKTAELIEELVGDGLIYDLQVSINTPLPKTPFYEYVKEKGWLLDVDFNSFDGGNKAVVNYPDYSAEDIERAFQYILSAYDKGRENSRKEEFQKNIKKELENIKGVNFLFLRSSRMWMIDLFSEEFFNKDTKNVDIICQPIIKDNILSKDKFNNIFEYKSGFFDQANFKKECLDNIIKNNYDAVIFFYNHPRGNGYSEVEEVAKMCSKNIFGVYPTGKIKKIQGK